jgi:PAS domain S-box-containing protein
MKGKSQSTKPPDLNTPKRISRIALRISFFLGVCAIFILFLTILIANHTNDEQRFHVPFSDIACAIGIVFCLLLAYVAIRTRKERDYAEDAINENKERYRSIIASSNTGAWEYHSDSKYLWCSPEYFELIGYSEKTFLETHKLTVEDAWINLLHPDDKTRAREHFANYMASGSSGLYENYFRLRHKDGGWVWIWSRGQTLRNHDGTRSNITLGTHIDITEKKNLEIELIKLNKKLLKYAHLNAHEVQGPVARLLGLIEISKLTNDADYPWFFEKVKKEGYDIDRILKLITKELDEIEQHDLLNDEVQTNIHQQKEFVEEDRQ